jgi:hypothetical protein
MNTGLRIEMCMQIANLNTEDAPILVSSFIYSKDVAVSSGLDRVVVLLHTLEHALGMLGVHIQMSSADTSLALSCKSPQHVASVHAGHQSKDSHNTGQE